MSDQEELLKRIAKLESELSGSRRESAQPGFDKRRAELDPIRYFKELGLNTQQITRHFVADALGKDCPPELSAMVQMGPQIVAQSKLEEQLNSLSRDLADLKKLHKTNEIARSVKTTTVDPAKYPTLAAATKGDPSLLEKELASLGDVADESDALAKIESKLKPYAAAFGFKPKEAPSADSSNPAETSNSDTTTIHETRPDFKPANNGMTGSAVPPLSTGSSLGFSQEDHIKLRDSIVKKYSSLS